MTDPVDSFARPLRIGTRGSDLALWQSRHVQQQLRAHFGAKLEVELEIVTTKGDQVQDRPLHEIGGKGLFVKAIEERLLAGAVDLAVHSMKDLPARGPEGLLIACTPERADPRDVLVAEQGQRLAKLPPNTRVGTGSLRRAALVRRINPGVEIVPLRGNVPTRIKKVEDGELDAVVLAAAGLCRLELERHIAEYLEPERFCPSPTQGILALQCRADDERVQRLLEPLAHATTTVCARAERAFLARLEAGCTVPVGCFAELRAEDVLCVSGLVVDPSGRPCFQATKMAHPREASEVGIAVAETLLAMGADRVLSAA